MFFDKTSVNIGRVEGNDIVLPSPQVSKQHVQIIAKETLFILIDISSANGTLINGSRVIGGVQIRLNDEIVIGPYIIKIVSNNFSTEIPKDTQQADSCQKNKVQTEFTRPYIRKILNYILRTDSQLDEFCIDHLPEVRRKISSGMDRTTKMNMIIEDTDPQSIQLIIFTFHHKKYSEFLANGISEVDA